MSNDNNNDPKKEVARNFKAGWDAAGRDGAVSAELSKHLVEQLGIHPERVQHYMDALMKHRGGRGPEPDPKDFKSPVVASLPRPDNGPKNDGGPA